MEADTPPPAPGTALTTRFRQQILAQRQLSQRDHERSQTPATRARRIPRLGRDSDKAAAAATTTTRTSTSIATPLSGFGLGRTRTRAASSTHPRPLLPVSERKSQEENVPTRRIKNGSQEEEKWELAPDGGSAGREGRQFAVANVGNNGRIYLR